MKLISEAVDKIDFLVEETEDGEKSHYIKGVFMQGNVKNRNGRIYPIGLLERESKRYSKEFVEKNRAFGELGHPMGPTINLDRVSHMVTELYREGDNIMGKAKIMETPMGNIVKNLMNEGATLGVSSRGMGSLKEKGGAQEVQDDFYLATAADIVADPSAPNAFVEGIMEGKEWIWNNGILVEKQVEEIKDEIEDAVKYRKLTEEKRLEVFENFLKKL